MTEVTAGEEQSLGRHPEAPQHCRPVSEQRRWREWFKQGSCRIFSPGRPLAKLLKWTVGVGRTSGGEGGQRQRERQPETVRESET